MRNIISQIFKCFDIRYLIPVPKVGRLCLSNRARACLYLKLRNALRCNLLQEIYKKKIILVAVILFRNASQ
jgi:hypothetical protein